MRLKNILIIVSASIGMCVCEWRRLYQSICVLAFENVRNGGFFKKNTQKTYTYVLYSMHSFYLKLK